MALFPDTPRLVYDPYFMGIFERRARNFGMAQKKYTAYNGADPYFNLIRRALGDLVDGEHFFDIVSDSTMYEVLYDLGWPRIIRGRADLMAAFRGYVHSIALQSADKLVVHKTDDGRVVVLEYEVHGTVLATRVKYNNRFCSVVKIENRKIVHWRDYMDSLAASKALTAKAR
jgi:uncharacterized protein